MKIKVFPSKLGGSVLVPSSKSLTHRAILTAMLCDGVSIINNVTFSNDVLETLNALEKLGVDFVLTENSIKIFGDLNKLKLNIKNFKLIINCFQSASTLRFLIPIVAAFGFQVDFVCTKNLINRIKKCCDKFFYEICNNVIKIKGKIKPGVFYFKNFNSSQFITGLLLILPILKGDSIIIFENKLESIAYVNLTVSFLKQLKIKIISLKNGFKIKGNQRYKAFSYFVEGDYSQAAFFGVAGCLNEIKLKGLNIRSKQSDFKILDILSLCGAKVKFNEENLIVKPGKCRLKSFDIDLKNNPDLAPVLTILASMCEGVSKISKISRLVYKESNRINSIFNMIKNLGGKIKIKKNSFEIEGVEKFSGEQIKINSYNDHRIVMSAFIASIYSVNPIIVTNCNSVFKSYPRFFDHFRKLGGKFNVISLDKRA